MMKKKMENTQKDNINEKCLENQKKQNYVEII